MSLESEIAALSSKATALIDYFTGRKTSIDSAVAAAVAAAPTISRTFYVDQLRGDDNAVGAVDSPLKTIDRAISATPVGGMTDIVLVEDYALASSIAVGGRRIMIRGENSTTSTRKLILNEYLIDSGMKRFGGFQVNRASSIDFADLTISLPDTAGGLAGTPGPFFAVIYAGGNTLPGFMPIKFYNVVFLLRGTFTGKIVGPGFPCLTLTAVSCTIPTALEGSLIQGVTAGKDPNTVPYLVTNITRL